MKGPRSRTRFITPVRLLGAAVGLASLLVALLSHQESRAQHSLAVNPDYAPALWLTASTGLRKLSATDGALVLHLANETTLQPLALDP